MTSRLYLLLGSNLGVREKALEKARLSIEQEIGSISSISSIYKTSPWQMASDDWFLNQVLMVETTLTPASVLKKTTLIEQKLGRTRDDTPGYQSRTIDIDILYIDGQVIETPLLTVPHPRLHERLFTLAPLVEIAPTFMHPVLNKTNKELLNICPDKEEVLKYA